MPAGKMKSILLLAALGWSGPAGAEHPAEKFAWYFENFPADHCFSPIWFTWERYRETFIGIPAQPTDNFGFDRALYEAGYSKRFTAHCFGMALMSLLMNQNGGCLGFCAPVGDYSGDNSGTELFDTCKQMKVTRKTGPSNPQLTRAIQEMQGHQLNLTMVRYFLQNVGKSGDDAYAFVEKNKPCLLTIAKDHDNVHCIVAYDAIRVSSTERHIMVYDSNRPWGAPSGRDWYLKSLNFVVIDQNGSWSFDFDGGQTWFGGLILGIPVSIPAPRDRNPASMGLGAQALVQQLFISGSAASLEQLADGSGKLLFRQGTKEIETDPGRGMLSALRSDITDGPSPDGVAPGGAAPDGPVEGDPLSGSSSESYFFLAPQEGPFDLRVRGGTEGYELLHSTGLGFLRVRSQAGGLDRVLIADPGTREPSIVLFNAAGAPELEVEIAQSLRPGGAFRSFKLAGLSMPRNGLVAVKLDREQATVQVESPLDEIGFDLEVSKTEGGQRQTLARPGITLGAGQSAVLGPSSWTDLSGSEVRVATARLSPGAVEARCELVSGGGKGPVGAHFVNARDIGAGITAAAARGSTTFDSRTGIYTQISSGSGIGAGGDAFQFAYAPVQGDFELTVEVVERSDPAVAGALAGRHGLMARRDCTPASRFSQLQTLTGGASRDWPRWAFRPVHGDAESHNDEQEYSYPPDQQPAFLKMVRRGSTFYGYLSRDGRTWDPLGSDSWDPRSGPVLVGFASTSGQGAGAIPSTIRFKVLGLGPIETPLVPRLPDAGAGIGTEVYRNEFEGAAGDPPGDFVVQKRSGVFTPSLQGGRLRLSEDGAPGSATSAFRGLPLPGIDSSIYQFEFELHLSSLPGTEAGGGVTFAVLGGANPAKVGFPDAGLGYQGIGREPGTDRNISTNSFAVAFDVAGGSAAAPELRARLIGQNNLVPLAEASTGLPDPFAPTGVHARVRYNRGRIQVFLGLGSAGGGALAKALEADVLPISFAAPGEDAVLGFTASTGDLTETAEVDGLVVTRLDCSDHPKVAEITGAPEGAAAAGSVVTLDGSGSRGGPGEEEEPVSHSWSIAVGDAAIAGPSDGPTVNVHLGSAGSVEVRLTVDGIRCSSPASVAVTLTIGDAPAANWTRCDCSGDGLRDISDPIAVLSWLFLGTGDPACRAACDCSGDGAEDITDAIFDLAYQFLGGLPPQSPYPACEEFPGCGVACPAGR